MEDKVYKSECEFDVSPVHLLALVSPLKSYREKWDPFLERAIVHKQINKVFVGLFFFTFSVFVSYKWRLITDSKWKLGIVCVIIVSPGYILFCVTIYAIEVSSKYRNLLNETKNSVLNSVLRSYIVCNCCNEYQINICRTCTWSNIWPVPPSKEPLQRVTQSIWLPLVKRMTTFTLQVTFQIFTAKL